MPVCSIMSNKLIETSCTVMDLKNVGIGQFWKVSSYVQLASKIGQHYYPETMGRFFIINAPYIFQTVWAVVKGWLDPVTREKIEILGGNYLPALEKHVPLENFPEILGGKCVCDEGCMFSDAGPWNTPEGKQIVSKIKEEHCLIKSEYSKGNDLNVAGAKPSESDDAGKEKASQDADAKKSHKSAAEPATPPVTQATQSDNVSLNSSLTVPQHSASAPASGRQTPSPLLSTTNAPVHPEGSLPLSAEDPAPGGLAPPATGGSTNGLAPVANFNE